jgi:hypothetical protein
MNQTLLCVLDVVWFFGGLIWLAFMWRKFYRTCEQRLLWSAFRFLFLIHFSLQLGYVQGGLFYLLLAAVPILGILTIYRMFQPEGPLQLFSKPKSENS